MAENFQKITRMAEAIVNASSGRIKLVSGEQDTSEQSEPDARDFLKLDGKRVARDLEVYAIMIVSSSAEAVLVTLLEELLLPIKRLGPLPAYQAGADFLREWGQAVYDAELFVEFAALL